MTTPDPSVELMRMINWYQVSQALHVAAVLGVADQLKDGQKSYDVVARACGAHPPFVYRLLRALAAVGVFHETDKKEFLLTPLGVCLTTDAPESRRDYARWIGTPGQWGSWGNLHRSIKSGESASELTYGKDAWSYRAEHPEEQAVFNSAMTSNSRLEAKAVLEAYDFSRSACIVDIGGGQGFLLKSILIACPATTGILFDQPQVIASAHQVPVSAELEQRYRLVAGSFFESVPETGDVYLMKAILHDWNDNRSRDILRTCRRAMSSKAILFVIERVVGLPNEGPEGKFSDLNMMVQYAALERTHQEFDDLLKSGGFKMIEVIPTRSPLSIIVGRPMSTD
jgi:O-methyltransferase/methyltransferase family protein